MFGTLDEVAQKIYDSYRTGGVTPSQRTLIDATLANCKKYNGLDVNAVLNQIEGVEQAIGNTEEGKIEDTIKSLNKKYNLDFNEIVLVGNNIRSLSQAASEAAITLQRQLKKMKAEQGVTPETTRLEQSLHTLMREINNNRYYMGILGFLSEASTQIQKMENILQNTPQSGSNLERASAMAKSLMQVKSITDGYKNVLASLSNIDNIISDERVSDTDKQVIKDQASK